MAKMNRRDKLELLTKKTARLAKKKTRLTTQIESIEREIISSVASGVEPGALKAKLTDLRRRARGPARQVQTMRSRIESMSSAKA